MKPIGRRGLRSFVIVAALSVILAACGSSSPKSNQSTGGTTGGTASGGTSTGATSGGGASNSNSNATVSIGNVIYPTSLDPANGNSGGDYSYLYLIYDRLLNFNPQSGAIEPGLATQWGFSGANNLTFTMTIRPGVKFQDGTPLDAAAVVASLQHFQKIGLLNDLQPVASITAPSSNKVVMTLKSPYSPLPAILADRAGMIVSPTAVAKYGSNFGTHPVGAGPYQFVSEVTNDSVNVVRFPGYWGGPAPLAGIDWKVFQTDTALVSAIKTGVVQVASGVSPNDVNSLKADSQLVVNVGPSSGITDMYFNAKLAPVSNPDVRLAFNYALNRQDLLTVATGGLGAVAWQVLPQGSPGYAATESPTWPQNVSKAKSLLAQAGYPNGLTLNCVTLNGIGYENTGPVIQSQEAAAGFKVHIKFETVAESNNDFFTKKDVPCYFAGWSGRPDAAMTYGQIFSSTAPFNPGQGNFGVDSLINQLYATYQTPARNAVIANIVKTMTPVAPFAPFYSAPAVVALSTKVQNYVPNFLGKEDFASISLSK